MKEKDIIETTNNKNAESVADKKIVSDTDIDNCVICDTPTRYTRGTHIDLRYGYVEGVGQLCEKCYV